jgi:uncharacterized membrane protein YedE/YeeE
MRERGHWNPYLAGALVGVVAILSVWLTGQYLGTSTTYVRAAGGLACTIAPGHVAENAYYTLEKVKLDWQGMLVIGLFIGALVSALTGGTFRSEAVPPMWAERFGPSPWKRAVIAFIGGAIMVFGARLAGGCPSGHGLSGVMVLSVSGLLAMAGFMAGGFATAALLFGRK